jgi:hypothetical protein
MRRDHPRPRHRSCCSQQRIGTLSARYLAADSTLRAFDDSVARLNVALDTATVGTLKLSVSPGSHGDGARSRRRSPIVACNETSVAPVTHRFMALRGARSAAARPNSGNYVQLAVADEADMRRPAVSPAQASMKSRVAWKAWR